MKFTDRALNAEKPKDKEFYLREEDGFVFRVRPTGSKSFYHIYDFAGKRQRLLIGNYPDMKLGDAREIHSDQRKILRKGKNPKYTKIESDSDTAPLTISSLAQTWFKWSEKNHSKLWYKTLYLSFNKDVLPTWGHRLAVDIRRKDALLLLETKVATAPVQARNILKMMRQMYGYAVDREMLEFNPFSSIKSIAIPALAPVHRDRVLAEDEIKSIWSRLGTQGGSLGTILALRLILLTAQRPGEVTGMRWDELSWGEGKARCQKCRRCAWWTIPADRSKNGKENRVYLPPQVISIVDEYGDTESEYICNIATSAPAHHVCKEVPSVGKIPFYGLPRWTPHDLRRTAATGLSQLGCTDEIVDAILNHQKQGVRKIYIRNKYDAEKRIWLTGWVEYLMQITAHARTDWCFKNDYQKS